MMGADAGLNPRPANNNDMCNDYNNGISTCFSDWNVTRCGVLVLFSHKGEEHRVYLMGQGTHFELPYSTQAYATFKEAVAAIKVKQYTYLWSWESDGVPYTAKIRAKDMATAKAKLPECALRNDATVQVGK